MKRLAALLLLAGALQGARLWAEYENTRREELTDTQVLDLHDAEKANRIAEDKLNEVRARVRREHGEDEHHAVALYDGYVLVTDTEASQ